MAVDLIITGVEGITEDLITTGGVEGHVTRRRTTDLEEPNGGDRGT